MGAVIVKGEAPVRRKLIAMGWNKNKTHPKARNYTRKIHAELAALIGNRTSDLTGTRMYVARITHSGFMATSKPCKDCMILIKEAGIKSVVYVDDLGRICTTNN